MERKPTIWVICVYKERRTNRCHYAAITQDGRLLIHNEFDTERQAQIKLGNLNTVARNLYRQAYPNGYELEVVDYTELSDMEHCEQLSGLLEAIEKSKILENII